MSACGRGVRTTGTARPAALKLTGSTGTTSWPGALRWGYTPSSLDSQARWTSARLTLSPPAVKAYSAVTVPRVSPAPQSGSSSRMKPPKSQPNRRPASNPASSATPSRLPKLILQRPSAMPPVPTDQAARTFPARMRDSISSHSAMVAAASKGSALI